MKIGLCICFTVFTFTLFGGSLSSLCPNMSVEEKVGQLLTVHFSGKEANEEAEELIRNAYVGGIIYYNWSNGLDSAEQVARLSAGLQKIALQNPRPIPLFIAADQEGGLVNRFREGFTVFPGQAALGATDRYDLGEKSAFFTAQELKRVGVNVNLGPVVDVASNPKNPVIGIRSFHSDPLKVVRWADVVLRGYRKAGVIGAIKHFPGHGDTSIDSHFDLPTVAKDRTALEREELYPFRELSRTAEIIMSGHLRVPALDENECATFSEKIIADLLRNRFGFEGIVMTDSLAMGGIANQVSCYEEAALKSLLAGHDIVLLGGRRLLNGHEAFEIKPDDILRIHRFLVESVKSGVLSEEKVDRSVARILALKDKYRIGRELQVYSDFSGHRSCAEEIAGLSVEIYKGEEHLPLKKVESMKIFVPAHLKQEFQKTSWSSLAEQEDIYYFDERTLPEMISLVEAEFPEGFSCVYFAYNVWRSPGHRRFLEAISRKNSFTIAVVVRDPADREFLSDASVLVCTRSPTLVSLQAAFDRLYR